MVIEKDVTLRAIGERLAALCGATREAWLAGDPSFTAYLHDAQQTQVLARAGTVSCILCTVMFHANHAHNLTLSP